MEEKREPESFMMRVARFIVNKQESFYCIVHSGLHLQCAFHVKGKGDQ